MNNLAVLLEEKTASYKTVESELESSNQRQQTLEVELSTTQKELNDLRSQLEEKTALHEATSTEISATLEKERATASQRQRELESKVIAAQAEVTNFKKMSAEVSTTLEKERETAKQNQQIIEQKLEEERAIFNQKYEELEAKLIMSEKELLNVSTKLAESCADYDISKKSLSETSSSLEKERETTRQLTKELESLLATKEEEIASVKAAMEEQIASHEAASTWMTQILEQERQIANQCQQELKDCLVSKEDEAEMAQRKILDEKSELEKKNAFIQEELENLRIEFEQKSVAYNALNESSNAVAMTLEKEAQQQAELKQKLSNAESQLEILRAEVSELNEAKNGTNEHQREVEAKLSTALCELEAKRQDVESLMNERKILAAKVKDVEEQAKTFREMQSRDHRQALETIVLAAQAAAVEANKELVGTKERSEAELAKVRNDCTAVEQELKSKLEQLANLEKKHDVNGEHIKFLQARVNTAENDAKEARAELAEVFANLETSRKKIADTLEHMTQKDSTQVKLERELELVKVALNAAISSRDQLQSELSIINTESDRLGAELERERKIHHDGALQLENLRRERDALQAKLVTPSDQLHLVFQTSTRMPISPNGVSLDPLFFQHRQTRRGDWSSTSRYGWPPSRFHSSSPVKRRVPTSFSDGQHHEDMPTSLNDSKVNETTIHNRARIVPKKLQDE